jgi:predicted enzyme related to lactoylglutathione lyase
MKLQQQQQRITVGLVAGALVALALPRLVHATPATPATAAAQATPAKPAAATAKTADRSPFEYIGGLAFHAKDPQALAHWYTDVLGLPMRITFPGGVAGGFHAGSVDFNMAIVAATSKHAGPPPGAMYMVLRVTDLDARVRELATHGVTPFETSNDKMGRFAMIHDPEGNTIGLWAQ